MRLTIVNVRRKSSFVANGIAQSAKEVLGDNINVNIENITAQDISSGVVKYKLGEWVVWQNSALSVDELSVGLCYMRGKIAINTIVHKRPMVTSNKFFQQKIIAGSELSQYSIPTYKVNSEDEFHTVVNNNGLRCPLVVKPIAGTQGRGIYLINNIESDSKKVKNWHDMMVSPYIENDGDYRVFVIGGTAFGAMKHIGNDDPADFVAKCNGFIKKKAETPEILADLTDLACKIASILNLEYGGFDIVRESTTGRYYLFDANPSGSWENKYNDITGENVPDEVIKWFIERDKLINQKLPLEQCLNDYLTPRLCRLSSEAQERVKNILNHTEAPNNTPTELQITNDFFNTDLVSKLKFLYDKLIQGDDVLQITNIILGEAEKSVSWAGNFLVNRAQSDIELSIAHTLENGAIASAYFIACKKILNSR